MHYYLDIGQRHQRHMNHCEALGLEQELESESGLESDLDSLRCSRKPSGLHSL